MDGLSAAASGIAVVSLAIQLVESVREIRRFLRDVSEAPNELKRLVDLLEQLELILENLGALVERQQQGISQTDFDMSGSILRAIKTCESKLKMLEDVVETAKKTTTASNKATRTFGSLKLACKKRDIEDFERQLHDAISLLNLTMTTNLTIVHSHDIGHLLAQVTATNQMTSSISKDLLLLKNGSGVDINYGLSVTATARVRGTNGQAKAKLTKRQEITFSSFSGPLGKLIIKREARTSVFEDEERSSNISNTQSGSTWVFMPSFLSYAFDFRYLNTGGSVERTLRTYPVFPNSHPVWDMCKQGDLRGIQKLLSNREISPFSVNSYGRTLLHEAVLYAKPGLCKFLLDLGLTGEETDLYGKSCYTNIGILPSGGDVDVEKTYELMLWRTSNYDVTSFHAELFSVSIVWYPVPLFIRVVREVLTKENINDCLLPPLAIASNMFGRYSPFDRNLLKPTIQHLIALGADVHRGSWDNFTVLDELMEGVDHPWDSQSVGREWLDILTESQIDVVEYLRSEYRLYFDPSRSLPMGRSSWYSDYRARYLVISEEPPSISWDWFIDAEGHAFEVLEEFKNFGPGRHDTFIEYHHPMHNWPYSYPVWQLRIESENNEFRLQQVVEDRYERRWRRKALKLAKAQGLIYRGPKMPGAWID